VLRALERLVVALIAEAIHHHVCINPEFAADRKHATADGAALRATHLKTTPVLLLEYLRSIWRERAFGAAIP
jgi:hypothetical protein